MRLNILLTLVVIAGTIALTWAFNHAGPPVPPSSAIHSPAVTVTADPAPNVTLTTLSGKKVALSHFRGKVVLLNFWASWCLPCVAEFPKLLKLAQENAGHVDLIAVSVDDTRNAVRSFLQRHAPDYKKIGNLHVMWDPKRTVSEDTFHTLMFPETIIIAPDMTMRRKVAGAIDWTDKSMQDYLRKLIHQAKENQAR